MLDQRLVHIAVADLDPQERQLQRGQGLFQPVVGHQRADHRPAQAAAGLPAAGQHVQQVVAVDRVALVVGHQHAVAVAVEGDAQLRAMLAHVAGEVVDVHRADPGVDVESVWRGADRDHLRAQLAEQQRRNVVGRAVRAVQHHLQPAQVEAARHAGLAELDVAADRVARAHRLAQALGFHRGERRVERGFDRALGGVVELLALGGEELDAVVVVRIVRGADHDAGVGAERTGQERDRRGRHRPEQLHIGPGGDQPGLQRRFEHVAGNARVLADHHRRPCSAFGAGAEHAAQRIAQAHHEIGGNRALPDPAADAIGAEIFARAHGVGTRDSWFGATDVLRGKRVFFGIPGCLWL